MCSYVNTSLPIEPILYILGALNGALLRNGQSLGSCSSKPNSNISPPFSFVVARDGHHTLPWS